MFEIKIMSRERARAEAFRLANSKKNEPTAIISITDTDKELNRFKQSRNLPIILHLRFDDVVAGEPNCMDVSDARKIKNFVEAVKDKIACLIIHCEAGVSRSAGIAAALMRVYGGNDDIVFNNPNYSPNTFCYCMVIDEYRLAEVHSNFDKNLCDKCSNLVVMNAFCNSKCEICEKEFLSEMMPGYSICNDCITKYNKLGIHFCRRCTTKILEENNE